MRDQLVMLSGMAKGLLALVLLVAVVLGVSLFLALGINGLLKLTHGG